MVLTKDQTARKRQQHIKKLGVRRNQTGQTRAGCFFLNYDQTPTSKTDTDSTPVQKRIIKGLFLD